MLYSHLVANRLEAIFILFYISIKIYKQSPTNEN